MKFQFLLRKIKRRVLFPRLFKIGTFLLLICFQLMPTKSFASNGKTNPKLNLKVGDVLHYQVHQKFFSEIDTTYIQSWVDFKVVDKTDTIYTIVGNHKRMINYSAKKYSDTNHPYLSSKHILPEINQAFPFFISESGEVQVVIVPDSTLKRKIKEECEYELFKANLLIKNTKSRQDGMTHFFQQFFVNWNLVNEGCSVRQTNGEIYKSTVQDISANKDFSVFKTESHTIPSDSAPTSLPLEEFTNSTFIRVDTLDGVLLELVSDGSYVGQKNYISKKNFNNIRRFATAGSDTLVTITGTVDDFCTTQNFRFYIQPNFLSAGEINFKADVKPGKHFEFRIPLNQAMAVVSDLDNFTKAHSNFLLEPGDSIHFTITPDRIEYSGKGALKNRLYRSMRENYLDLNASLPEVEAKQEAKKWISTETQKLVSYKNKLSGWAYNQMRCDIYYSAMDELTHYYYLRNKTKVNAASFEMLFDTISWEEYQSFSSVDMLRFIDDYLNHKLLIMKGAERNRYISETDKYHLAQILLKDEVRYMALSQCVHQAINGFDKEEGRNLFFEYERTYKRTGFYQSLKRELENRIELWNGAVVPDFTVTDMQGKKVSLNKFKGKYVQLMFVDLYFNHHLKNLEAYQKLREELPKDKFEMITVFVNEDESIARQFIKENSPKGILIMNPGWENEQLKKFDLQKRLPYFLINPEGIIVFTGAGSPAEDFTNIIIEMINSDIYNKAESSVSKRILYWVLSFSAFLILLILTIVIAVTRSIKRREARRREQIELKLSAVRSQLNPHFLFNSMSSIQYLVNNNENEKANIFLSKFAQLMRKILFQSEVELVPLNEELDTIETYLELEALRHHFNFRIQVDDSIDKFNIEIPVMLLQPFVENAVIHGIGAKSECGLITIEVKQILNNRIQVVILDNGDGMKKGTAVMKTSNGKGIQLTEKRINLMMAKYQNQINFKIENRGENEKDATGTRVEIIFETEH